MLGRKYSIEEWALDGLVVLYDAEFEGSYSIITFEDAHRLGLDFEVALKIAHIRNE